MRTTESGTTVTARRIVTGHGLEPARRGSRPGLAHGPDRCSAARAIIHRCPPAWQLGAARGSQRPARDGRPYGERPGGMRRRGPRDARAGRRILETSPFPILLVSLVGIVLLSVFAPSIVVGDTWLTLMAGREVVDHGLPHTEHITILGEGRTWTDQQWLAQVVFYVGARARRDARGDPARHRARAARTRSRHGDGEDERRLLALDLPASASSPCSPARGAGRCAHRQRRFRSTPARSGCWSTRPAAAFAGGRCSCCRCSSCGRTSTARSSSARSSRCCSASSRWCGRADSPGSLPRSSCSRRSACSRPRTGRSSSPTTT